MRLPNFSWCGRAGSSVPFLGGAAARRTARRWASHPIRLILNLIAMANLKVFTVFASAFFASVAVAGPNDPVSVGLQLALVKYDAVHGVLIERCKLSYPESVNALVSVITNWKAKNDPAVRQLRHLSTNSLMKRLGLSESEATAQLARSSELLTSGLKNQFGKVPESQLKAACEGQYAEQSLASPTLDFDALLAKVQAGNVYP
jgi:uncharacterized protein YjiS (DUF1127 family)